jgi:hypothetical protein
MKNERNDYQYDAHRLLETIESASEAIARLLQTCGSSRNFGSNERHQFERLLRHRRELIAKLETLRRSPAQTGRRTTSPETEKRSALSP